MPTVILRGSKRPGHKVSRLVLEGSSSNPVREALLNGEPFEVSDEEFAKLDASYVLEPADDKSDINQSPSGLVAASEQDET
jgi:hypothetical protein